MLRIASGEAGVPGLALVAFAIAIGVLGVEDVGDVGDEDAVLPGRESGGMFQAVEEEGGLIVHAVAIGVFEDFHAACLQLRNLLLSDAAVLGFFAGGKRVVAHFHDPHAALRIPVDEDRVLHQRLGGYQHGFKARF